MSSCTLQAPAKLNLFLHITGRRADGYHALESLVVFTDLADLLTVTPANEVTLEITGPFASSLTAGSENLVLRAATLLQVETGTGQGAHITLEKHIPLGAGLGGGSADAAATLKLLNDFWGCGLDEPALCALGKKLGADVPMCIVGKPNLVRGIGDIIEPPHEPLPPLYAVLVYPNKPLSTAEVYAAYAANKPEIKLPSSDFRFPFHGTHNDLQRAAVTLMLEIAEILLALETSAYTRLARMTGSGSCCFALTDTHEDAQALCLRLQQEYPHWWVRSVTPIHDQTCSLATAVPLAPPPPP